MTRLQLACSLHNSNLDWFVLFLNRLNQIEVSNAHTMVNSVLSRTLSPEKSRSLYRNICWTVPCKVWISQPWQIFQTTVDNTINPNVVSFHTPYRRWSQPNSRNERASSAIFLRIYLKSPNSWNVPPSSAGSEESVNLRLSKATVVVDPQEVSLGKPQELRKEWHERAIVDLLLRNGRLWVGLIVVWRHFPLERNIHP